uniref:Uncharacterized protein n=1 Tax=Anguilla anguilla TaxID=7936 RepID=A0A0E9XYM8_ANGAN
MHCLIIVFGEERRFLHSFINFGFGTFIFGTFSGLVFRGYLATKLNSDFNFNCYSTDNRLLFHIASLVMIVPGFMFS